MKLNHHIKRFEFRAAQYYVGDYNGGLVLLDIDYKHNSFKQEVLSAVNASFVRIVENIAADLLKRKYGVNFAKKR